MSNNLPFNERFFRSKTGTIILPEHLDFQFNNIADYINNQLIPYIESINFDATNGEAGYPLAPFCNINNIDVGYQYLNDINLDDGLLSLDKFVPMAAGSVLGSNNEGNIFTITPTDNDQLIFVGPPDPDEFVYVPTNMVFRKITTDDIADNSLTGQQIAEVSPENFIEGTFNNLIADNSLTAVNLRNITDNNIALGEIGFQHIGKFSGLPYVVQIANQVTLDDFDNLSITPNHIRDNTISWVNFINPKPINSYNLANGFIDDTYLIPYVYNGQPPNNPIVPNLIASRFSSIINFPNQGVVAYQGSINLTADKITLNCLSATNFTQDIQDAIIKYQQIKNQTLVPPVQKTAGQIEHEYLDKLWYYDRSITLQFNGGENINNFMNLDISNTATSARVTVRGEFVQAGYSPIGYFSFYYNASAFKSKISSTDYEDVLGNTYNQVRYKITIKLIYAFVNGKDSWIINVIKTP